MTRPCGCVRTACCMRIVYSGVNPQRPVSLLPAKCPASHPLCALLCSPRPSAHLLLTCHSPSNHLLITGHSRLLACVCPQSETANLGAPNERFMIACNRPENDEHWESAAPKLVGKASMGRRHRFMLVRDLSWSLFNVLAFGLQGVAELRVAVEMLEVRRVDCAGGFGEFRQTRLVPAGGWKRPWRCGGATVRRCGGGGDGGGGGGGGGGGDVLMARASPQTRLRQPSHTGGRGGDTPFEAPRLGSMADTPVWRPCLRSPTPAHCGLPRCDDAGDGGGRATVHVAYARLVLQSRPLFSRLRPRVGQRAPPARRRPGRDGAILRSAQP